MIKKLIFWVSGLCIIAVLAMIAINVRNMQKMDYVIDEDGNVAIYAYTEKNPDYDPNEDTSVAITAMFNDYMKNKYCFAFWAPHGALWQDECFDNKSECQKELKERMEIGSSVNAKNCYKPYLTNGWCIRDIKTGYNRYYYDGTYGEMETSVCASSKKQCEQLEKYKHEPSNAVCHKQTVLSHPSMHSYLWSQKDINKLIKDNENAKPVIHLK